MKHFKFLGIAALLCLASCVGNSTDDVVFTDAQGNWQAVVMERSAFEGAVSAQPVQSIVKTGKIYVKGDFLFVNDVNRGFHVFNYSDPLNPIQIGYINAPGATDLAVRGNNIYINQAVDLLTVNYNSANNTLTVTKRNKNVFPQKVAPNGSYGTINSNQVIIDWVQN